MSFTAITPTPSAPVARAAGPGRPKRRLTPRHIVLLALVPVLVVVWLPLMGGNKRTSPVPPPVAATATAPAGEPPAAPGAETAALPMSGLVAQAGLLTRRLQALSAPFTPRWTVAAGDPFAAAVPPGDRSGTLPDAGTTRRSEPVLLSAPHLQPSALLLSPDQPPMAIIRGRAYRPGDEVDGCRIVAIEERCVVFGRGGKTFSVSLPAPPLGQDQDHD